ncbi:hypothetical protein B7494_g207 [Chlorociboria aeruginascens]|nr:hypothetical protein B7494_g207 [Chlorociboria aeruginascens]
MWAQKFIPALAVLGVAAAQTSASLCSQATATINSQADATQYASCSTISGSVLVGSTASGAITLDGPEQITGSLSILNASLLTSFSSSTINAIAGDFTMQSLTVLSTLSFTELSSVGTIAWDTLPALSQLTFPSFVTTASSVVISNTFLSTLDGINLDTVATMNINNNNRLKTFSTQVGNVTTGLTIASNGQDLAVSLPNLIWAANIELGQIASVTVPSLAIVNGSLSLSECYLTSFAAPNLTAVGDLSKRTGALSFADNVDLTNISLPELTQTGGAFQIANNTLLGNLSFPALVNVGGAVDFTGNLSSASLPDLNNVQGNFNLQSTADFDCTQINGYKTSGVIQGTKTCDSKASSVSSLPSGSGTSTGSSASASASKKNAAPSFGINEAVAAQLQPFILSEPRQRIHQPELTNIPTQSEMYRQSRQSPHRLGRQLQDLDITSRRPSLPRIPSLHTPFNNNPLRAIHPNTPPLGPSIRNRQAQTFSPFPTVPYSNLNPDPNAAPAPSIPLLDFTYHPPRSLSFSHATHNEPTRPRSGKEIRHCKAEKARRDQQSIYIDLGVILREKFRWPEDERYSESSASTSESSPTPTPVVSRDSSFSTAPTQHQSSNQVPQKERDPPIIHEGLTTDGMSNGVGSGKADKGRSKKKKDRLTKQDKLQEDLLWKFRACLRIDRMRVREWLDDVREKGEELTRRKEVMWRDVERDGREVGFEGEGEERCSKDEALLRVWKVMERDWDRFWCAEDSESDQGRKEKRGGLEDIGCEERGKKMRRIS